MLCDVVEVHYLFTKRVFDAFTFTTAVGGSFEGQLRVPSHMRGIMFLLELQQAPIPAFPIAG